MDPVRVGLAIRALRRRRGLTQAELARKARLSQAAVSRCETGEADRLTHRALRDIAEALDASVTVTIRWHGEDLDRLLDAAHADIVEVVVRLLRELGWEEVVPEATFSVYGERGSIDVLAFSPSSGALLVVEVKSVVPDMQATLSTLDRKVRLAPSIAAARGWKVRCVSRMIVLPDDRTARRRIEQHAATVNQVMPLRTLAVRRWLAAPTGAIGGIMFLSIPGRPTARRRVSSRKGA
jgi:transcriptional regulator with XRE-family HTH domain